MAAILDCGVSSHLAAWHRPENGIMKPAPKILHCPSMPSLIEYAETSNLSKPNCSLWYREGNGEDSSRRWQWHVICFLVVVGCLDLSLFLFAPSPVEKAAYL